LTAVLDCLFSIFSATLHIMSHVYETFIDIMRMIHVCAVLTTVQRSQAAAYAQGVETNNIIN
jgi:hypothetical protein